MKKRFVTDPAFYREVMVLASPIVVQNLITNALAMADIFMVGLLGEQQMAAVTMANIPLFVVQLFIFGAVSGCSVLMSQYWGKGDLDSISRVVGLGCMTTGVVASLCALTLLFFPTQFLSFFGNEPEVIELAVQYGRLAGLSWIFNGFTMVFISAWRSVERPEMGLYILVPSMCCNTFLNWVFIFGNLGAPALGVTGAALATLISRILEFGIVLSFRFRGGLYFPKFGLMIRPGMDMAKRYLYCSAPVIGNETLWGMGTAVLPTVMGHMEGSTEILAAHAIVGNVEKLFAVVALGLATTASVVIGREIGAGRKDDIQRVGWTLNTLATGFGGVIGMIVLILTYTFFPWVVFPLFQLSPRAMEVATFMLTVQSLGMFLKDFNTCCIVGVLRGGGDVQVATVIDLIPLWLGAVPYAAVTGLLLGLSIHWVYMFFVIEQLLKFIAGTLRVQSGKWVHDLTGA